MVCERGGSHLQGGQAKLGLKEEMDNGKPSNMPAEVSHLQGNSLKGSNYCHTEQCLESSNEELRLAGLTASRWRTSRPG